MIKKYELQPGDIVRLIMSGGKLGERYEYVRDDKDPGYCWIRQPGTAPNGKPYAAQQWVKELLSLDRRSMSDNDRLARAANASGAFKPFICIPGK